MYIYEFIGFTCSYCYWCLISLWSRIIFCVIFILFLLWMVRSAIKARKEMPGVEHDDDFLARSIGRCRQNCQDQNTKKEHGKKEKLFYAVHELCFLVSFFSSSMWRHQWIYAIIHDFSHNFNRFSKKSARRICLSGRPICRIYNKFTGFPLLVLFSCVK